MTVLRRNRVGLLGQARKPADHLASLSCYVCVGRFDLRTRFHELLTKLIDMALIFPLLSRSTSRADRELIE